MSNLEKVQNMTNGRKINFEGGVGYELDFKEKLVEFFSLGLLNGNFYQTQEEVLKNGKELFEEALEKCPEFATKCAIYGNNVNSMKLVPTIWLVYLSTLEDKTLFKKAFPRIIRNPKMLHDFMEIARKGGIRQGLGRSIKKAINDWLVENLNEYQVSRNKGKLKDVVKVTRPNFKGEEFQNYMKYLIKDEITFDRAKALKEVIAFMEEGKLNETTLELIEKYRLQLEELKHSVHHLSQEDKKSLYTKMYKGLNYTALVLNLVALERVFATKTQVVYNGIYQNGRYKMIKQTKVVETDIPAYLVDFLSQRLSDVEAYRRSNMLPFALINASRLVVTPEFKSALAKLFQTVSEEAFSLPSNEKLFVVVDTSASMREAVNDTGSLSCVDVASLFGSLMKKSHSNTRVFAVATDMKEVELHKQDNVFTMAKQIENTKVGFGTRFEQIMRHYNDEKYIVLITDSVQADNLEREFLRKRAKGAKLIVWQLIPYGTRISKNPSVIYTYGYSDRALSLIKNIIEGRGLQIEEIEKIEL